MLFQQSPLVHFWFSLVPFHTMECIVVFHATKLKLCLKNFVSDQVEASYFDRINMAENGLEYDQKKFTPMNMNVGN